MTQEIDEKELDRKIGILIYAVMLWSFVLSLSVLFLVLNLGRLSHILAMLVR